MSLLIIDLTDNTEYFLHKFNLSNEEKNRIIFLNNVFKNKLKSKYFSTQNLMKILYTYGRERLLDIIRYQSIRYGKKENFKQKIDFFEKVEIPKFPTTPSPNGTKIQKSTLRKLAIERLEQV